MTITLNILQIIIIIIVVYVNHGMFKETHEPSLYDIVRILLTQFVFFMAYYGAKVII